MALSKSGRWAVLAGEQVNMDDTQYSHRILVYDLKHETLLRNIMVAHSHVNKVVLFPPTSVAISPDERYVMLGEKGAIGPGDPYNNMAVLPIHEMATGNEIAGVHELDEADVDSIKFLHDGRYMVASEVDNYIKFWKFPEMQLVQEIKAEASSLAVSPDGKYLAGGGYKKIIVWAIHP